MIESTDKDFTAHTPMMQQDLFLSINLLKQRHKVIAILILVY